VSARSLRALEAEMSHTGERLVVDPIACTRHGMCAELFPERIELDDWGYPVIDDAPVPPELREHAQRAIRSCPAIALKLRARR